jgi:hypothetical protein
LERLWDSSRVQEYNPHSLGRTDLVIWKKSKNNDNDDNNNNNNDKDSESSMTAPVQQTKIVCAKSQAMRQVMELTSVLHVRAMDHGGVGGGGGGYMMVSRGVQQHQQQHDDALNQQSPPPPPTSGGGSSEILLNVVVVVPTSQPNTTLMILVNHMKHSQSIPSYLATRMGRQAAVSFFENVKQWCAAK